MRLHGVDPASTDWESSLSSLPASHQREYYDIFRAEWHEYLDRGHGECVLRRPELSMIVQQSLLKFDVDRYHLTDFIIMPNHVHLLAAFLDSESMLKQCENWKHFQAFQINRRLGRKGRFWQQDSFDHLVRSEAQFEYLRRYIADNPQKANLPPHEYLHYSKVMSQQ